MPKFFNWEITRLIQFHDCLFIVGEVRGKQFLHVPVSTERSAIPQNVIYIKFPLCRVASQLDVVTLSSNVFPSCTIQNNCRKFVYLDSHFAKAGRRLGPVYMEVGVNRWVRWPA